MPDGRPSDYTTELGEEICLLMAEGMSALKISKIAGMPSYRSIMRWLNKHEDFRHNYMRAREARADFLAEEALEIIDDKSQDILDIPEGGDTRLITNSAAVQRAKLQFEGRKWAAAQMAPKKWGQQNIVNTLQGADGKAPVFVVEIVKGKGEGDK